MLFGQECRVVRVYLGPTVYTHTFYREELWRLLVILFNTLWYRDKFDSWNHSRKLCIQNTSISTNLIIRILVWNNKYIWDRHIWTRSFYLKLFGGVSLVSLGGLRFVPSLKSGVVSTHFGHNISWLYLGKRKVVCCSRKICVFTYLPIILFCIFYPSLSIFFLIRFFREVLALAEKRWSLASGAACGDQVCY